MARPKSKAQTRRVFLRLDEDAADLLDRLAPSENKRGQYVSSLLRRMGREAGLIDGGAPPAGLDLAVLQQQLQDLQARVAQALEQQADQEAGQSGA